MPARFRTALSHVALLFTAAAVAAIPGCAGGSAYKSAAGMSKPA